MKTYKKTHTLKAAHDSHLKKIKANGGTVLSDDGKTITYGFPTTSINKKYTHFAVRKSTNKIATGWDYTGYDSEDLNSDKRHYFFDDLADLDIDKKDVSILTKAALSKKGINPFDEKNWGN
jgi:hypothetical protein